MSQSLKELFCRRFECPPGQFEELAFKKCLPLHAAILAPLIRRCAPRFFGADFDFIHYLGDTTTWFDARAELLAFEDERRKGYSLFRHGLRLRVSARKATLLASRFLRRTNDHATV